MIRDGEILYVKDKIKKHQKFFGPVDGFNLNLNGNYYDIRRKAFKRLQEIKQRQYYIQVKNKEGVVMTDILPVLSFEQCPLTKSKRI